MAETLPVESTSNLTQTHTLAERISSIYAKAVLEQAGLAHPSPRAQKINFLDNACGTGVVSAQLITLLPTSTLNSDLFSLTCADSADAMVAVTEARIRSAGWPNARAVKADAMDTGLPAESFSHVVCNFGPAVFEDPVAGLREMERLLAPRSTLGVTSWCRVGWVDVFREAFSQGAGLGSLPPFPDEEDLLKVFSPGGRRWVDREYVREVLVEQGFADVVVREVSASCEFTVQEALALVPGSLGLMMLKCWSKQLRDEYADVAVQTVKKYLVDTAVDGKLTWQWVANVATARKKRKTIMWMKKKK